MKQEDRVFSMVFIIGSLLLFLSSLLTIISFSSPYWTESDLKKNLKFSNIGLWQVCFHRYKHNQFNLKFTFTGCYWIWSDETARIRNWLIPPWFYTVQIVVSIQLICVLLVLLMLSISYLTTLRNNFFYVLIITFLTLASSILMLTGLLMYGINSNTKEWMPSPEDNIFSWAYWCQLGASFFSISSASFFFSELRSIYRNKKIKSAKKGLRNEYNSDTDELNA